MWWNTRFNVELLPSAAIFKRQLRFDEMLAVGQILFDLHFRTNNEDNHINFAIGDWVNQVDDWFGEDVGVNAAVLIKPTRFSSCFISYSHKDELFVKRLHSRLSEARIPVWFAPEDIKAGEKLYEQIDQAIHSNDKLLIVLSHHSLHSEWVMTEIRKARQLEIKASQRKLMPIRLVDMEVLRTWTCFDADTGKDLAVEVREYFIQIFRLAES